VPEEEAMRIIIDAYNVIRTNPESKRIEAVQGNQKARDWLISACRAAVGNGEEWVLVFDGDGDAAVEAAGGGSLAVRFSAPRTADEVIRECGEDAVALHIPARIVSSDREVQVTGCDRRDSASFIDYIAKRTIAPQRPKAPSKAGWAEKIIQALRERGAFPPGARVDRRFQDELVEIISYLCARKLPPQKMARDIEKFLRDRLALRPDPQKEIFRTLKKILE
jgi:predicted RNA-binding protein with PIN domain